MKKIARASILVIAVVFVTLPPFLIASGCRKAQSADAVALVDAGGSSALCQHLNAVGCAQPANCQHVVDEIAQLRVTNLHVRDLMAASSRDEVIAVGSVSCALGADAQ